MLRAHEQKFLAEAEKSGATVAVLDMPLLYETGGEKRVDAVVVVTTTPEMQRERILARGNMTAEKLDAILARQMPDAEKRKRADFMVDTSHGLDPVRAQIRDILAQAATMPRRRTDSPLIRTLTCAKSFSIPKPPASIRCAAIAWSRSAASRWSTACRPARRFTVYLNPERDMPAEAFAVHGLSAEFLADKPLFADVVDEFLAFIGDAPLIIHNASFDIGFINAELDRIKRPRDRARAAGRYLDAGAAQIPACRTASTICARATASTIPAAPSTAPCSTPNCWPRSISS